MVTDICDEDEAVSPVIATVLLLAITVMLSSMVFIMMQSALTSVEKSEPEMTVSVKGLDNGFHVVRITSLDQALDPARLEYQIYPSSELNANEYKGFVDEKDGTWSFKLIDQSSNTLLFDIGLTFIED